MRETDNRFTASDHFLNKPITWVLGNAPSQRRWIGMLPHPSVGCNLAIRDYDFDYLVCVDRMAMVEIRRDPPKPNTEYWTKTSPLELPEGWKQFEIPGIDSGSAAVQLALELYPNNTIICCSFDGILGYNNSNAYEYPFRPKPTPVKSRQRHRRDMIRVVKDTDRVYFVSPSADKELRTISYDTAARMAWQACKSISKKTHKT